MYWDDGRLGTRKLERLVKILLLRNQTGLKIEFLEEVKTRDVTDVKVVIGLAVGNAEIAIAFIDIIMTQSVNAAMFLPVLFGYV